jgi:hypothetical protein
LDKKSNVWGGIAQEAEVVVREAFPPRTDEDFRLEQIPYVAALPDLITTGHVELFSSFELKMEEIRNTPRDRGYLGLDLLEGVPIGSVKPPVSRTTIFSGIGQTLGITKEEQVAFLKSITDERFIEIRQSLDDGSGRDPHIGDAYHFWTAEHAGLDIFLTMDGRFIREFERKAAKKINPRAEVMSPKQLCEAFGVGPKDIDQLARDNPPFG